MSLQDLYKAFSIIEHNKNDCCIWRPVTLKTIKKAERALNLKFPLTYRYFLQEYGGGYFGRTEVEGIIDENFDHCDHYDAVRTTLNNREKYQLPLDLIVIGTTGYGPDFVLDYSRLNLEGECLIIV